VLKSLIRCALTGCLLPALLPAAAAADIEALRDYYRSVDTLTGRFTQQVVDERGEVVKRSKGDFALKRPDRFNWLYSTPYKQRLIADGKWLYVHDMALRQVSIRPLDKVLGAGPAVLLSGEYEALNKAFTITGGTSEWLRLTPRGIREKLDLLHPIYARTAAYGHFGQAPDAEGGFSWERTDIADELARSFGATALAG